MKRKAASGEAAREAKRAASDRPPTMDIEKLCDAIPILLRILSSFFTRQEQVHVLGLVSKAWKSALPLYLPVRKYWEEIWEFWEEFEKDGQNCYFFEDLPANTEFLHALEDRDVRIMNFRKSEDGAAVFDSMVRIRPDAPSVVSVDLERKLMELELRTTPTFRFRCSGPIIGWARRRVRRRAEDWEEEEDSQEEEEAPAEEPLHFYGRQSSTRSAPTYGAIPWMPLRRSHRKCPAPGRTGSPLPLSTLVP